MFYITLATIFLGSLLIVGIGIHNAVRDERIECREFALLNSLPQTDARVNSGYSLESTLSGNGRRATNSDACPPFPNSANYTAT